MLTSAERLVLRDELLNDPLARGYAAMNDTEVVASLLEKNRPAIRPRMASSEVFQAIDISEFVALSDQQQRNVMALLAFGWLNPQGKEAALFVRYFGAGSNTITSLATARAYFTCRAAELGVLNVIPSDVALARA